MPFRELAIAVEHAHVDSVGARLYAHARGAPARRHAFLLAHGAGLPMGAPLLEFVAEGLAGAGYPVLAFQYPYMERRVREGRKRPPDPPARLESAHRAALAALAAERPDLRILLIGKSLGGRIGSHLAAKGEDCAGLVHLGYPLHPAGRPAELRSEHFPAICQPALFVQGTRDALCDLDLLREALRRHAGAATLELVLGGDHSFELPARLGRSREDVWGQVLGATLRWAERTFV